MCVCRLTITLNPWDLLNRHQIQFTLHQFTCYCFQWTCPIGTPNIPCSKSHIHFPLLRSFQRIHPIPRCCGTFHNKLFLWQVVSPLPNPQAGGSPHVSCPQLLLQYICSYPPYPEAVSSIHDPRTHHAIVTWIHIHWTKTMMQGKYYNAFYGDCVILRLFTDTVSTAGNTEHWMRCDDDHSPPEGTVLCSLGGAEQLIYWPRF